MHVDSEVIVFLGSSSVSHGLELSQLFGSQATKLVSPLLCRDLLDVYVARGFCNKFVTGPLDTSWPHCHY